MDKKFNEKTSIVAIVWAWLIGTCAPLCSNTCVTMLFCWKCLRKVPLFKFDSVNTLPKRGTLEFSGVARGHALNQKI